MRAISVNAVRGHRPFRCILAGGLALALAALPAMPARAGSHEACLSAAATAQGLYAEAQALYQQCVSVQPDPSLGEEAYDAVIGEACAPARAFCEQYSAWGIIADCESLIQSGALDETEVAEADEALQILRSFNEVACPPQ